MNLKFVAIIIGALIVVLRLPGVLIPAKYREAVLKFPRSVLAGRILMGIVAVIVWGVMYHAANDEFRWARPLIVGGVPLAYWLVIQFGATFLSLRAMAAIFLLIAKQILDASDVNDSPARLVMAVFAYVMVSAAVWMTVSPHQCRDMLGYTMANDQRCRATSGLAVLLGVFFVGLGVLVY